MRIGAIGHQRIGHRHHPRRDIAVQVEADDERNLRADRSAHAPQQLAFAVIVMLGDHGAVQVEIDAVQRQRRGDALHQFPGDGLESLGRDMGGGARRAPERRHELPVPPTSGVDEAGSADIHALHRREDRFAARQRRPAATLQERLHSGHAGREGVGFVKKPTECDTAWHSSSPRQLAPR